MNPLHNALEASQQGNHQLAEQYFLKALSVSPTEPIVKQHYGVFLYTLSRFEEAYVQFLAAQKLVPNDTQNILNLALCCLNLGKNDEVASLIHQLKSLKADDQVIESLTTQLNQNMMTLTEKVEWLQAHLKNNPNDYDNWLILGDLASETEKYTISIQAFKQALNLKPQAIVPRHNLGLAYRLQGDPERALQEYDVLIRRGKLSFQLFHNMGNALSDKGELDSAIQCFVKAIELNPQYLESHKNLNDLYWETKQHDLFLRSYSRVIEQFPENLNFVAEYVRSLIRVNDLDSALGVLEEKQYNFEQETEFQFLFAKAAFIKGDEVLALSKLRTIQAVSSSESNELFCEISELLIELGDVDTAERLLEPIIEHDPQNQMALALIGLCWREKRDNRLNLLNRYSELVQEFQLFDIDKNKDDAIFIQQLKEYLSTLHCAKQQPLNQTLTGGTQTRGSLFSSEHPLICELVSRIREAINHYINTLQSRSNEWFPIPEEDKFTFSGSWSVSLNKQGFHANHIHSMGWISSVFYVNLPSDVEDSTNKSGWLSFGEPNLKNKEGFPPVNFIKPHVGKLVLFPSYCWHGTVPFQNDENRMTVAFDVIRTD